MLTKARYLLLGTALLLSACATTPSLSQTTPVSTPAQSASPTPRSTPVEGLTPTAEIGGRTAAEWYAVLEEAGYGDARAIVHRRLAEVWDASVASPAFQWQVRKLNARINLLPFIAAKHLENGQTIDDVEEFYMNGLSNYGAVFCEAYLVMTEEEKSLVHRAVLSAVNFLWSDIVLLLTSCASTPSTTSAAPAPVTSPFPEEFKLTAAQWYTLLERIEYGIEDTVRLVHRRLAEAWDTNPADPRFRWLVRNVNPKIIVLPLSAAEYLENGHVIADLEAYYLYALSNYDSVFCEAYLMMTKEEKSLVQELALSASQDGYGISLAVGSCIE